MKEVSSARMHNLLWAENTEVFSWLFREKHSKNREIPVHVKMPTTLKYLLNLIESHCWNFILRSDKVLHFFVFLYNWTASHRERYKRKKKDQNFQFKIIVSWSSKFWYTKREILRHCGWQKKKKFVLFSGDKKHHGHVKIEPTFYLWTVDSSLVRITVRDHELFTYLEQSGSKVILKIHFGLHVMCINALFLYDIQ